jgi:CRISP-associated protein Cas1
MEPYRPYVDKLVVEIINQYGLNDGLPTEIKVALLKIPVLDVMLDDEKSPLMNATQRTAVSLVKCFTGELRKPLYPIM